MKRMIIDGKYYTTLTGGVSGNEKYSKELKERIEEAGHLCLANLQNNNFSPIMMMGNIQSGKTRAFIGLMSLCFDNEFDMTIILTKCSTALVKQTVSRMTLEFECFKSGNATVGEVVAQDILDIDFRGCAYIEEKQIAVKQFLKRYKGKKRIIVVKKQADNVDRMNMFIENIIKNNFYKRLLIVDDEADITSIGFDRARGQDELSLRRISGAINTMRKSLHSNIEHVLMQVTATPYALYLQPENFSNSSIMPIKPSRTVVLPTGEGYIGGQYYFIDSEDEQSIHYKKSRHLLHIVNQEEMDILNGSRKNSGKNSVISDKRTVRIDDFLISCSGRTNFVLPSLRNWIFDVLVGTAVVQYNPGNEDYYLSAVIHAAITKNLHKSEKELIEKAFSILTDTLSDNINNENFVQYVANSYEDLKRSVEEYGILVMPSLQEVLERIASLDEDGELSGLINEVDIKEVNSDSDISRLLNLSTGELKLENSLTIFVGGQVLDRGITIPNMISFFYGRDPKTMQQDTVMQHCRMFGYRGLELLSVTRFYTTYRLFSSMKEITIRDNLLRERMLKKVCGEVVYLEAGGKIKACSPQKILASEIRSIIPEKRYLPIGFEVDKKIAKSVWKAIDHIILKNNGYLSGKCLTYKTGECIDGKYVIISSEDAMDILMHAYSVLLPKEDGLCNAFPEMESIFLFSLSERMKSGENSIALIVRKNRELSKMKRNGTMYQDAPDDGKNEGAIAKLLREDMPVLVLTEQIHPEWGAVFWWPVYYTPGNMNVGLYAEENSRIGIYENVYSAGQIPISIEKFNIIDNIGLEETDVHTLNDSVCKIQKFYMEHFEIPNIVESSKKRKQTECLIYIDCEEVFLSFSEFVKSIDDIIKNVKVIFSKHGFELTDSCNTIISYLKHVREKVVEDREREYALHIIEELSIGKNQKQRLRSLIDEADELVWAAKEILGYFMPLGSGRCEIHLNYYGIKDVCMQRNIFEEALIPMIEYVMSHEIYHAIHYSDVMTQSGRWLYKNRDYHKQCIVKESMAEYFALSFAKERAFIHSDRNDIVRYIRDIRKVEEYPGDGGYSGALILEKQEREDQIGKRNEIYIRVYGESLSDMPKAFDLVKEIV